MYKLLTDTWLHFDHCTFILLKRWYDHKSLVVKIPEHTNLKVVTSQVHVFIAVCYELTNPIAVELLQTRETMKNKYMFKLCVTTMMCFGILSIFYQYTIYQYSQVYTNTFSYRIKYCTFYPKYFKQCKTDN